MLNMQRGLAIFIGVTLTFSTGWVGLIVLPHLQLGELKAQTEEGSSEGYPRPLEGLAAQGRAVYVAEGCVYCHSQQVRAESFGTDIARGWGDRRTVPRDYIYENPILLGSMRTGPDLANIGARQPDETWHLLHLYNPVITSPGSIMPPFAYLFEKRRIVGERAYDALPLKNEWAPAAGFEIIPTDRAKALVAYLKAQNRTFPLKEASR
jgi:cytochrome c oxidase cbb3-type subunit II